MPFIDEIASFSNDYTFDGNNVFHWLKTMVVKQVREEDMNFIVSKIMSYYLAYLADSILGNLQSATNNRLNFILETEQWFDKQASEEHEYLLRRLDTILGNFIRASLGRNLSYVTHEITSHISPTMTISLLVKPTRLSDLDKYHIYLDNIEEEGGWVSDRMRRKHDNRNEYH